MKRKLFLILICLLGISNLDVLSQSFQRKVVMEEGTGTWCGWCVRGIAGMAMMKEKYPDTFIGIAVHNGDPMTVEVYDIYLVNTTGLIRWFPDAVVNRKIDLQVDPFYGAETAYLTEMEKTPIAGIELTGGFTNSGKQAIDLKTVTRFGSNYNNANFRLAYVLIENGITGYAQANFYAGGESGTMDGYENKPDLINDMVYNDVARGIYSGPTGIAGSIPGSITAMTPIEHTYTINLPASIVDANQLEVVVMLLNVNTGEIENADKIEVDVISSNIPVTGVSLDQNTATLTVGKTLQLKATVSPDNATNKNVSWSSSAPTVASVDETGTVSALTAGTTTITVTTEDGNITATCDFTIHSDGTQSFMFYKDDQPLEDNAEFTVTNYEVYLPEDDYLLLSLESDLKLKNITGKDVQATVTQTILEGPLDGENGYLSFCFYTCVTGNSNKTLNGTMQANSYAPGYHVNFYVYEGVYNHIKVRYDVTNDLDIMDKKTVTVTYVYDENSNAGLDKPDSKPQLNIFQEGRQVKFNYAFDANVCQLEIYNLLGQKIAHHLLNSGTGIFSLPEILTQGIYLCVIKNEKQILTTQKFRIK